MTAESNHRQLSLSTGQQGMPALREVSAGRATQPARWRRTEPAWMNLSRGSCSHAGMPLTERSTVDSRSEEFAHFVDLRQRALQRTAWLLTGDWPLAEDLVQTALARTWPRWERIKRRDDPEIYVRRVMVNTWATWSRRKWRGERPAAELPDGQAPGDVAGEVAVRLAVRRALASLSDRQRAVFVLR